MSEIVKKLAAMPKVNGARCRTVVCTQGDKETIVSREGVVTLYPTEPMASEKIIDTNGAGDAFVGGFLSRYLRNKSIAECVAAGGYSARHILAQSGVVTVGDADFQYE